MKKKNFYIPLFILIIVIFFSALLTYDTKISSENTSTMIFKVAGDNNFPPYEYVDENGNYTGFNVDIMRAVALQAGIEVIFYPMSWQEACDMLKQGEVDIIEGMKFTKERNQYYDFSEEYLENSQSIFVPIEDDTINNLMDLSHKKVAVQQGDMVVSNLQRLTGLNIFYSKDQEHAMEKLLNKEVDAYIGNTLTGVFLMNKIEARDKIKIVGENINPTKYSIVVKKGNLDTIKIINKSLSEIKKNGTYDIIYRKWFGQPTQFPSWYIRRFLLGMIMMIVISIVGMLIFYRWNYMLKKEVDKQTCKIHTANESLIKKNIEIKQERDFRGQILNEIFSGIVTINSGGIITFVNELADRILDTEKNSLLGKHYTDTSLQYIFDPHNITEQVSEIELVIHNQKLIINYKMSQLSGLDQDMEETILIIRDVTEERWMQENIKTKDKLQSLGNLISGIAHEIRNPLTSIKTYAELIPKKFDNPKFREMVSKDIPLEIERLNILISDLLEYSKPRKPFKEKINLHDAINSVMLLLKNKLQKEIIEVKTIVPKDTYIYMDKNHLRQVLINILLNAIESMDKEEKRIFISVQRTNNTVLLDIRDTGNGMSEDDLSKIYNPFYTTKAAGTGLGLFVCYQLLMENGAQIKFDSIKSEGTTCRIQFKI